MVSSFTLAIMVLCVITAAVAIVIPYISIKKKSSKLETGLPGALCYGALGYVWNYLFYMFLGALIMKSAIFGSTGFGAVMAQIILTLLSTGFTVLALYWGMYLTNQKQNSIYRSVTVGVGFSLGKMAVDLFYPYIYSFVLSIKLNSGATGIDEKVKQSILNTSNATLISGMYKCILMMIFIVLISIFMGHFYRDKKVASVWIYGCVIYEIIMLINVLINNVCGDSIKDIVLIIVYTIIAIAVMPCILLWFKNGKIVLSPVDAMNQLKAGR